MITTDLATKLVTLVLMCERLDLNMELERDTGRYVPGGFMVDSTNRLLSQDEIPPEHVRQGPSGWRVQIGEFELIYDVENDLHPDVESAVSRAIKFITRHYEKELKELIDSGALE